ncbi:Ferredoxin-dependent glutamate synthase [hydrothermal vent metagenome]|uniref:Ferredoxin-dependent glutamate synthase n=1 Tax=hydrothermal vent metagenome TaxID=652676 RepID=A0A3B0WC02_9ZZZZ
MSVRQGFVFLSILFSVFLFLLAVNWPAFYWGFIIIVPIILLGVYHILQTKHTILRLYPVIGIFRYIFESIRPEIQQYFVESDINGRPINREFRSLVYQRAKHARDTRPFGTQFDVYRAGYEWMDHSMKPLMVEDTHPRIKFGCDDCSKPYLASPMNISAMSYGALSKHAILALNKGAKIGNFAHNTGEGGLSPYHLKHGGDIIWQIGTGYFGCRNPEGKFDREKFSENAQLEVVKMIEIKLSQGAKPGHGGILPAAKLSKEIAAIRHVPMGKDVISPPAHSAFDTPEGLLQFVAELRKLSGGKPVGFKLCIGKRSDFLAICKAMLSTGITPDFITVDGGEGGTGAAPIELTNSVGTPLRDALIFVNRALIGIGKREQIRIIASGKIFSAFHVARMMALGADTVNSARGMMLALGCIQSRSCNTDKCPTGVATQDPARYKALNVEDKSKRVANFQNATVKNLTELLGASGLNSLDELKPHHINRRVNGTQVANYAELYPSIESCCLLGCDNLPDSWKAEWEKASAQSW